MTRAVFLLPARFGRVGGSAYVIGGFGITAFTAGNNDMVVAPIR